MELYCFKNGDFMVKGKPKEVAEYMATMREINEVSVDVTEMLKQIKTDDKEE